MPMPPPMAFWRLRGIDLMIDFRILVTVIRMLKRPQMKTIESACCQVNPSAPQTV